MIVSWWMTTSAQSEGAVVAMAVEDLLTTIEEDHTMAQIGMAVAMEEGAAMTIVQDRRAAEDMMAAEVRRGTVTSTSATSSEDRRASEAGNRSSLGPVLEISASAVGAKAEIAFSVWTSAVTGEVCDLLLSFLLLLPCVIVSSIFPSLYMCSDY